MIRQTFVFLSLLSLPAIVSAESDSWEETIQSAAKAYDAGDYQQAKKLFAQAVEETEAFPSTDLRRAKANIGLARTLLELGAYFECEQLGLKSIEFLQQHHSEKRVQIARAESVLTRMYLNLRLVSLAERHCELGIELTEASREIEYLELAELHALMRLIWNVQSSRGDSRGGKKAYAILDNHVPEDDPRWIILFQALAGDCYNRWEPKQASRAVTVAETVYGNQHPRYAECLSTLATAYRHKKEFEQSEQHSKQVIQLLTESLRPDHPKLAEVYRNLATIEQSRGHSAQAVKHLRESIRLRFSTLTDANLCYFFGRVLESELRSIYDDRETAEMYLSEMTQRGGDVIEDYLTRIVNTMQHNQQLARRMLDQLERATEADEDLWDKTYDRWQRKSDNLEILTALRRVQQKPDPLKIFIKEHDQELTCVFPDLPVLEVAIRNMDVEQREVGFTEGGNYRSGRQARWRIEASDGKGRVYEPKPSTSWIAGGVYNPTTLKPGEGWQTSLEMESFVEILPPGEYQIRILYHNQITIVDNKFTEGLIVSRSDPIKLIVEPRRITVTKEQQKTIDSILPQLNEKLPVKIVGGKYGPWAHDFVKPDSPYGRLLAQDWSAVPSLLAELQQDKQSSERRAHLLALLYSITAENDPGGGPISSSLALGSFSRISGGWYISSQREGEQGGAASFSSTSGPYRREGKLVPKHQEPYIKNWQKFSQYLEVVRED